MNEHPPGIFIGKAMNSLPAAGPDLPPQMVEIDARGVGPVPRDLRPASEPAAGHEVQVLVMESGEKLLAIRKPSWSLASGSTIEQFSSKGALKMTDRLLLALALSVTATATSVAQIKAPEVVFPKPADSIQGSEVRSVIGDGVALDSAGYFAYRACIAAIKLDQPMTSVIAERKACKDRATAIGYALPENSNPGVSGVGDPKLGSNNPALTRLPPAEASRDAWQGKILPRF